MKKTFVDKQTIISADFLNSIYGGDSTNTSLPSDDPRKIGHVHDGGTEDGHASKINLETHVTGSVNGNRVMSGTITKEAIYSSPTVSGAIPVWETVGSTRMYKIDLKGLENVSGVVTEGENIVLLSDGNGGVGQNSNLTVTQDESNNVTYLNVGSTSSSNSGVIEIRGAGELFFNSNNNSNYSSFRINTNQTKNISYRLPPESGSTGQVLSVQSVTGDSSGSLMYLEWQDSSSGITAAGPSGSPQLSDGFGQVTFKSGFIVDSNNMLSVGGSEISGLLIPGESMIDVENSIGQKISLSYNNSSYTMGSSSYPYSDIITARGNITDVTLPIAAAARPASPIVVTSTKNNSVELQFELSMAMSSLPAVVSSPGNDVPTKYATSGRGGALLLASGEVSPDYTGNISYDFALFSDSANSSYYLETASSIGSLVLRSESVNIDGDFVINKDGQKGALKLFDSDGSNYLELSAAQTITSSYSLTLPNADGSNGQVLKTDGSGNLGWTSVSGSDNLGDHTATQNLDMSNYQIDNAYKLNMVSVDSQHPAINSPNSAIDFNSQTSTATTTCDYNFGGRPATQAAASLNLATGAGGNFNIQAKNGSTASQVVKMPGSLPSSTGQVLSISNLTNANQQIELAWSSVSTGITDVVSDLTPQLGGALDANGHDIDMGTNSITFSTEKNTKIFDNATNLVFTFDGAQELLLNSTELKPSNLGGLALGSSTNRFGWGYAQILDLSSKLRLTHSGGNFIDITNNTSGPTSSYTLYLPTTNGNAGEFLQTDGSGVLTWATVSGSSGIANVVEDLTPQLGGNLDANGNNINMGTGSINFAADGAESIYSDGTAIYTKVGGAMELGISSTSMFPTTTAGLSLGTSLLRFNNAFLSKIYLTSNDASDITISNPGTANYDLVLPTTAGSAGQYLQTDGTGTLTWATVSGGSGISNVVEDTTPQLGGTLDANGNNINMGTSSITFAADGAESISSDGVKMIFSVGSASELSLNSAALYPTTNDGLDLGTAANTFNAAYVSSLKVHDGSGNVVTIQSPSIVADYTLTLPTTDGSVGQYLQTNGSGTLSWATVVQNTYSQQGGLITLSTASTDASIRASSRSNYIVNGTAYDTSHVVIKSDDSWQTGSNIFIRNVETTSTLTVEFRDSSNNLQAVAYKPGASGALGSAVNSINVPSLDFAEFIYDGTRWLVHVITN